MPTTRASEAIILLGAAMRRVLEQAGAPRSILAGWPDGGDVAARAPSLLPVLRFLPHTMAATAPETDALAAQLIAEVAGLAWEQSFAAGEASPAFLANYGWTEIIGPTAPLRAGRLSAGFLLLGPRVAFPLHRHPAEEVYVPLSGTAYWRRGRRPFAPARPGQIIHHSPWLPHAMRTSDAPLLAMYVWRGDDFTQPPMLG